MSLVTESSLSRVFPAPGANRIYWNEVPGATKGRSASWTEVQTPVGRPNRHLTLDYTEITHFPSSDGLSYKVKDLHWDHLSCKGHRYSLGPGSVTSPCWFRASKCKNLRMSSKWSRNSLPWTIVIIALCWLALSQENCVFTMIMKWTQKACEMLEATAWSHRLSPSSHLILTSILPWRF